MDSGFALAVVGFIALFVVIAVLAFVAAKKRREALEAFATAKGWTYTARDDSLARRFDGRPFGQGYGRHANNVLRGVHDGRAMVAFDYQYTTSSGSGKDRTTDTHHYSVVVLSIGAVMPALSVSPEGMFGRIVGRLTNTDIELESEDFNRAFTVRCPDRKFAFDVLHPQTMQLLLGWPDLGWRFEGDSMLVVTDGRHSVEEVEARLGVMDAILDGIPEFVWAQVRGR